MPALPASNKTEQVADAYSIAKIEIARAADGFQESMLTLDAHIGKEKADTDPVTGYKLFDAFETRTLVNISMADLESILTQAVKDGKITAQQLSDHVAALLAMDAQLIALAQQTLDLYHAAGLVQFPERVSRFV